MHQWHSHTVATTCHKQKIFSCHMMALSGTYGCTNIIVHANHLVVYTTKEMRVFLLIYLITLSY